jgi:hypothetical protein
MISVVVPTALPSTAHEKVWIRGVC